MTELLERAFAEAAKLPAKRQNEVARWLLDELASGRAWDESFERSPDKLEILGEEALAEHRAGNTLPLDLGTE